MGQHHSHPHAHSHAANSGKTGENRQKSNHSNASQSANNTAIALNIPGDFRIRRVISGQSIVKKCDATLGVSVRVSGGSNSNTNSSISGGNSSSKNSGKSTKDSSEAISAAAHAIQAYGTTSDSGKGSQQCVETPAVVCLIGAKVAEAQLVLEQAIAESLGAVGKERFPLSSDPIVYGAIRVPEDKHARVIGKGAATLHALQLKHGCFIDVPRRGEGKEDITVEGRSAAIVIAALDEISQITSANAGSAKPALSERSPRATVDAFFGRLPLSERNQAEIDEVLLFPDETGARLERFLAYLRSPTTTVDVCVFTISDFRVADILVDLCRAGVRVRVLTDDQTINDRGSAVQRLADVGCQVKIDAEKDVLMHHKFALCDSVLINGSFNWTRRAAESNWENVIVSNHPKLVQPFRKEFERLWSSPRFSALPPTSS